MSETISRAVLTVGQTYKDPRGGISSVIKTYAGHFTGFKFVATYNPHWGKWLNVFQFASGLAPLLATLMLDRDIKVVHMHVAERGSFFRKYLVLLIARRIFRKKVVFHSHGAEFHLFYENSNSLVRRLVRSCINECDMVICLSRQWETFFRSNFDNTMVEVLENIVDQPVPPPTVKQTAKLQMLFLGEIGERKGIFDLIEAIAVKKEYFSGLLRLRIGGKGDTGRLSNLVDRHGLQEIVSFEGWVSGIHKDSLLGEADVYVLPSYNEGLPISILEAMSYGLPVISTNVGGIPEVVHDRVNGFVIAPGDITTLAERIQQLVGNPVLRVQMGKESLRIVTPYYASSVIPKLEDLYASMLNRGPEE